MNKLVAVARSATVRIAASAIPNASVKMGNVAISKTAVAVRYVVLRSYI